ncbi:MAG TPA: response regulator transcription factor [Stellaceae bacterium]|nr:response regulator transcription factor [Stellaceae bacterium]
MKILIADDHALVRQGLRQLLADDELGLPNASGDLSFLEADGFDAALEVLAAKGADLLLIDLSMPGMAGANSLRALREAHPNTKIVVITGWEDRATMLDCLGAGVHGYVPKSFATDQIVKAIEVILGGGVYVPSEIANLNGAETVNGSGKDKPTGSIPTVPGLARFTKRQLDVLQLLGQGRSTKEIARALELSEGTVKVHLAAIYRGLNARNRTEAVALASKLQL